MTMTDKSISPGAYIRRIATILLWSGTFVAGRLLAAEWLPLTASSFRFHHRLNNTFNSNPYARQNIASVEENVIGSHGTPWMNRSVFLQYLLF